jgi:hypothetical protein
MAFNWKIEKVIIASLIADKVEILRFFTLMLLRFGKFKYCFTFAILFPELGELQNRYLDQLYKRLL